MAEQQTIKYAPQWNNMTVDNVTFQTNNVKSCYQLSLSGLSNFLKEFWSTDVSYDPFPSTDETEQCTLKEFLIKFSVLNRQRPLTLNFTPFVHPLALIIIMVLGGNYSSTKQVNSIQQLLAYSLITGTEGPEIPGALFKKSKKPKSKKPPIKTNVTPPKPIEGSEQSHSVPSGTVPDP
ncbi:hypothetical protein Tco_1513208 [Tanacetum coccineum]